jgi:hypothetical protein
MMYVLVIERENLEPRELQMIGFLWDKFPLPKGQLHIKDTNNKLYDVFKKYKKLKKKLNVTLKSLLI